MEEWSVRESGIIVIKDDIDDTPPARGDAGETEVKMEAPRFFWNAQYCTG